MSTLYIYILDYQLYDVHQYCESCFNYGYQWQTVVNYLFLIITRWHHCSRPNIFLFTNRLYTRTMESFSFTYDKYSSLLRSHLSLVFLNSWFHTRHELSLFFVFLYHSHFGVYNDENISYSTLNNETVHNLLKVLQI
jgi:hypothetical protein